jgi:hypothetical protein
MNVGFSYKSYFRNLTLVKTKEDIFIIRSEGAVYHPFFSPEIERTFENIEKKMQDLLPVPRIIWIYWHSEILPSICIDFVLRVRKHMPNYTVNILHRTSQIVQNLVPGIQKERLDSLKPAHFADWLRLQLLICYGGIWMDSSIYINDPEKILFIVHQLDVSTKLEIGGFHISKLGTAFPVLENWLLISRPLSPFLNEWITEYNTAIKMGFDGYAQNAIMEGIDVQQILGPERKDYYLTQHVCAQVVIQRYRKYVSPELYMVTLEATSTGCPFEFHGICRFQYMCIAFTNMEQFKIIKLRRGDRFLRKHAYTILALIIVLVAGAICIMLLSVMFYIKKRQH